MDPTPPPQRAQTTFWGMLTKSERETLMLMGHQRRIYPGDVIGGRTPEVTLILPDEPSCWVRLQAGTIPSCRGVLDLAGPGQLIDVLRSTDPDTPSWAGTMGKVQGVAISRGRLLEVTDETVPILLQDLPRVYRMVRREQSAHFHFMRQLHVISRASLPVRLAHLLLSVRSRFGEKRADAHNVLSPPLTQSDIAAWLGVSERSLARVLQEWRTKGLVHTGYATVSILNPKEIRKILKSALPVAKLPTARRHASAVRAHVVGEAGADLRRSLPPGFPDDSAAAGRPA